MALHQKPETLFSLAAALFQRFMDNNPNRDRQDRSPQHADSDDREPDNPPPTELPEQPETGGAVPESSTEVSRIASEMPATRRVQSEVGGGDGSGQRSRGPKRSRAVEEGAGPSGPRARKKPQEFDAPPDASPCSVCGRRFGSWKALFGHMRSHPDRDWRGIHPPPKFNREGTPENDQEVNVVTKQAENLLLGVAHEVAERLGTAAPDVSASPGPTTVHERVKKGTEIEHKCSICSQVFSSGPALGGHMRSHSDRQSQAAASSSSASRIRGLGIDLNMPNEPVDEPARRPSSPPPPSEGKEGGFDLNRRPTPPSDEE